MPSPRHGRNGVGNKPSDGGNLLLSMQEANEAVAREPFLFDLIFDFVGSQEFVKGIVRRCFLD